VYLVLFLKPGATHVPPTPLVSQQHVCVYISSGDRITNGQEIEIEIEKQILSMRLCACAEGGPQREMGNWE